MNNPSNYFEVHLNSNDNVNPSTTIAGTATFNTGDAQSTSILAVPAGVIGAAKVGMGISDAGNTYIAAGTTIQTITLPSTLVLSAQTNAGAAAVGRAFTLTDTDNSKCSFNLGSVLDQTPNAQNFQNETDCLIKVKYFSVEQTAAEFTTAVIQTVQIRSNILLPNTIESQFQTAGIPNMGSSNILGVIPVGNTTYTYSDLQNNPNDWKCSSNPFRGQIEITITDSNGTPLTLLQSKNWYMVLCVYFSKTDKINNFNMPKIL